MCTTCNIHVRYIYLVKSHAFANRTPQEKPRFIHAICTTNRFDRHSKKKILNCPFQAWGNTCARGKCRPDVPVRPDKAYRGAGWQGWWHWLVKGAVGRCGTSTRPFDEALSFARGLQLAGNKEWVLWCASGKRPADIPPNPEVAFRNTGWRGWAHWLHGEETGRRRDGFRPFADSLAYARSLQLQSSYEWQNWSASGLRPTNVPGRPHNTYKDAGWEGYNHWLGVSLPTAVSPAPRNAPSPPTAPAPGTRQARANTAACDTARASVDRVPVMAPTIRAVNNARALSSPPPLDTDPHHAGAGCACGNRVCSDTSSTLLLCGQCRRPHSVDGCCPGLDLANLQLKW